MWLIKGKKTRIRYLLREDVDKMQNWGRHADPLLMHYNFPKMSEKERDEWYKIKAKKLNKRSYAIENLRGEVIGYLSIRDIKWLKRESELGIVMNPNAMNKGYGTDAIQAFLEYYFRDMRMSSIVLRAAKYNERAIQCYKKCGFRKIGEGDFEFEDQYAEIFYNPAYADLKRLFVEKDQKIMTRYTQMRVTRQEFIHRNKDISTETSGEM